MRDIYVCVIFLRVKIYWMFFYWSRFFDVHFSYCEVFMCQVLDVTQSQYWLAEGKQTLLADNKPAWQKVSTLDE